MEYEIDTIQYGEYKDTFKYDSLENLLNEICNIHEVRASTVIIEIRENGKSISKMRMKELQALALK